MKNKNVSEKLNDEKKMNLTQHMNPAQKSESEDEWLYPRFCDFSCPHAEFSDPSAVGACRRDIGVWCGKADRYHNKNARCLFRSRRARSDKKKHSSGSKKTRSGKRM